MPMKLMAKFGYPFQILLFQIIHLLFYQILLLFRPLL